jgi:hypothetical protein
MTWRTKGFRGVVKPFFACRDSHTAQCSYLFGVECNVLLIINKAWILYPVRLMLKNRPPRTYAQLCGLLAERMFS